MKQISAILLSLSGLACLLASAGCVESSSPGWLLWFLVGVGCAVAAVKVWDRTEQEQI